ncbi:Ig-like domain-containing protein [uncultured Ruminococcus sp.]|uniref:Ig-like domain-containing protein n=1 Tax=uncultured Ruminococcus sp. TaxID=165186 RepID=UPI00292D7068|nr:Ig-like domain-containing protein [uncultured Ruminococcus sp.]
MKRFTLFLLSCLTACIILTGCGEKLKLNQKQLEMTVGDSVELSAGKATKVSWDSSNDDVVTVNGGVVNAKSAGEAVITASSENGETDSCHVKVSDKLISEITLSATGVRIEVGKTIQLEATYRPADASHVVLNWSSSDASIATVNEEGFVTGIAPGVTTITRKSDNDISASCTVNVGSAGQPTVVPTQPSTVVRPTETSASPKSTNPAAGSQSATSGGMLFPDSSTRYLTTDEIAAKVYGMSGTPLSSSFGQDAVNEIYARHGFVFRTASIRAYYEAQSWYHPDPGYDGSLSAIEQYNVGLLSQY